MNSDAPEVSILTGLEQGRDESSWDESSPNQAVGTVEPVRMRYALYALALLVLVNVFILIDRQILTVLAEDIKADLGLSDGDLGFLFGTAFAVFYAVFGIPLGRLADSWNRTRLISISVSFWSLMTALSGVAKSFVPLAVCRFGVGVGEAGVSPAGSSLLYDYFSPKFRTTVLGFAASGGTIGAGVGVFLGGTILGFWNGTWPDPSLAPFGLKGWQAAFMVVGLPGLLLALLVSTLKEPPRGQAEYLTGQVSTIPLTKSTTRHPFRTLIAELLPMVPGVNIWVLRQEGAKERVILINLVICVAITMVVTLLLQATGELTQWLALGLGLYSVFSWVQVLVCRDPVCFSQIFRCKTVCAVYVATGCLYFANTAVGFWMIPWFRRAFGVGAAEVGSVLGPAIAVSGLIGVVLGGVLADWLRRYTQRGKLYVALGSALLGLISTFTMLSMEQVETAYVFAFVNMLVVSMNAAPLLSTVNDLMIPRTRATAVALYIMTINFMGFALGPYCVGLLSDVITRSGADPGEALRQAMLAVLVVLVVGVMFLVYALRHLAIDEDNRLERARALGENI